MPRGLRFEGNLKDPVSLIASEMHGRCCRKADTGEGEKGESGLDQDTQGWYRVQKLRTLRLGRQRGCVVCMSQRTGRRWGWQSWLEMLQTGRQKQQVWLRERSQLTKRA